MKLQSIKNILELASQIKKISEKMPKENQKELNRIHQELLDEIQNF